MKSIGEWFDIELHVCVGYCRKSVYVTQCGVLVYGEGLYCGQRVCLGILSAVCQQHVKVCVFVCVCGGSIYYYPARNYPFLRA